MDLRYAQSLGETDRSLASVRSKHCHNLISLRCHLTGVGVSAKGQAAQNAYPRIEVDYLSANSATKPLCSAVFIVAQCTTAVLQDSAGNALNVLGGDANGLSFFTGRRLIEG